MGARTSSFRVHARFCALLVVAGLALALPSAAFADVAKFSSATPKSGSYSMVSKPKVSAIVYDRYGAKISGTTGLFIDGHRMSASCSYIVTGHWNPKKPDRRRFKLSYQVGSSLSVGVHTATIKIKDLKKHSSTYSWKFSIDAVSDPVTFSALTPADGSSSQVGRPRISASALSRWDVKGSGACALTLDGAKLSPQVSYTKSGSYRSFKVSFQVPATLTPGPHTVALRVLDAAKRTTSSTWSFTVIAPDPVYDEMPVVAARCTDCHGGFPAAHPMTDCAGCHAAGSPPRPAGSIYDAGTPMRPVTASTTSAHTLACTIDCHRIPWTGPYPHMLDSDCTRCHNGAYRNIPSTHPVDAAAVKDAHAVDPSSCTSTFCHATTLTSEHYRLRDGVRGDCGTCHAGTVSQAVKDAIASGDTDCSACHDFGTHAAPHAVVRTDTCAGAQCHAAAETNLITIHKDCATCHDSTDAAVAAAITGGYTECRNCHDFEDHVTQHAVERNDTCAGAACHVASNVNLITLHTSCATCHTSTDPAVAAAIADKHTACASCHDSPPLTHEGPHTVVVRNDTCVGAACHPASDANLITLHASCDQCHESADADVLAAISSKAKACRACHDFADHEAKHAVVRNDACSGVQCHAVTDVNLITLHESCEQCHGSTRADVVAAISGDHTACASCHAFANHDALHVLPSNRSDSCVGAGCHDGTSLTAIERSGVLSAKHALCVTCHGPLAPQKTKDAIATGHKMCTACHDPAIHRPAHSVLDRADGCLGSTCHDGTNLTTINRWAGLLSTKHTLCITCHGDLAPLQTKAAISAGLTACTACHDPSYHRSAHNAPASAAGCLVEACHAGTNLIAIDKTAGVPSAVHADCATCHGVGVAQNVSDAVEGGPTDCTSCHDTVDHVSLHDLPPMTDGCVGPVCHAGMNLTAINRTADTLAADHTDCATCHGPDAPQETRDAVAGGLLNCTACHLPAVHELAHSVTDRSDTCGGADCHDGTNLLSINKSRALLSTVHADCERSAMGRWPRRPRLSPSKTATPRARLPRPCRPHAEA